MRFIKVNSKKRPTKDFPVVVLLQDNWDDFGLKTTFHATYWRDSTESVELGNVKILRKGQTSGYTPIPDRFSDLPEDFCSLGQNLEFYETVYRLRRSVYERLLKGIRDVVFGPLLRAGFEDERGFKDSLLRSSSAVSALDIAPSLFSRQKPRKSGVGVRLDFKTSVGGTPFVVSFDFGGDSRLPGRINVLIGYNGTGKTQLLANLAMVAATSATSKEKRKVERNYGRFIEAAHSFGAVVAISYSAFDTFDVPGANVAQRKRVAREGGLLGYTYCGLRDLESWQTSHRSKLKYRSKLKSFSDLANDFKKAVATIERRRAVPTFVKILAPLALEPSIQRLGILGKLDKDAEEWGEIFYDLSSGHKIVLSIAAHLAAYLQKRSLVIFDEPEAHLHPPLLAAVLKSLRIALDIQDSYCVLATHSPVALQETPARFVQVLRRFGESTSVVKPVSETFGENIGILTRDAFDLNSSETDYHGVLEGLAADLTIDEIENLFGHRLGFQARSYIISIQKQKSESDS
jgi:predicted ATPase